MNLQHISWPDLREILRPDDEVLITEGGGVDVDLEGLDNLLVNLHLILFAFAPYHFLKHHKTLKFRSCVDVEIYFYKLSKSARIVISYSFGIAKS